VEAEIQASRNEAIVPRDAGGKKGCGFLGQCVIYGATMPPSCDQANRCGNSLLLFLGSPADALGKHLPLGPAEQRWATDPSQDDAEWHRRSTFDTGLMVCLFGQEPA